jgi:hypothetical protein
MEERDIVFATTTLFSDCLEVQRNIIKNMFPNSQHILIDGRDTVKWPNSMFYWINLVKETDAKYFILIDEDCFLTDKEEILKTISLLDEYDFIGCPDGYHPARTANPIVINPFLLFGRIDKLKMCQYDMSSLKYRTKFTYNNYWWQNSENIKYKHIYKSNFKYDHPIIGDYTFDDGKEPFYPMFWNFLDLGFKLGYLFPYFDKELKSTLPKINEESNEMAIHIWESRNMDKDNKLFGTTTNERFEKVLKYLNYEKTN